MWPRRGKRRKGDGKIDVSLFARAIGATATMTLIQEKGRNYLKIVTEKEGRKAERRVPELSESEAKSFKLLGTAAGENFWHCLYLANKYAENFLNRVCGYCFTAPSNCFRKKGCAMAVAFYEKSKK